MFITGLGYDTSARRAVDKAQLNQERLKHIFHSIRAFTDSRRQRIEPHGAAAKLLNHGQQHSSVRMVKASLIDFQQGQGLICNFVGDNIFALILRHITHTFKQAVGNTRRPPGTAGNFLRAALLNGYFQNLCRPFDNRHQYNKIYILKQS